MDFEYKHFHQQRLYAASREELFNSARAVMAESVGWTVTNETSDGFSVEGSSFGHAGIATIQIRSTGGGTLVDVELRVERAGFSGFMLFDVGGYYNIQIRKWLNAIQASLHQQATGQTPASAAPLQPPNKSAARVFHGCLLLIAIAFGLYLLATVVEAVVGLTTGNLFLVGRNGSLTVHGPRGSCDLGDDPVVRGLDRLANNEEAARTIGAILMFLRSAACAIL
jgi:hypothetical protein